MQEARWNREVWGVHVFARHSMGSLLVKHGCDLLAIKDIMRHSDVQITMRYLHTSEASKREKYERYLVTGSS